VDERALELGRVQDVRDAAVPISGTTRIVPSKLVTAELETRTADRTERQIITVHEVKVDDRWRFILADATAYQPGACPTIPPGSTGNHTPGDGGSLPLA
jgi:hypothetical protein